MLPHPEEDDRPSPETGPGNPSPRRPLTRRARPSGRRLAAAALLVPLLGPSLPETLDAQQRSGSPADTLESVADGSPTRAPDGGRPTARATRRPADRPIRIDGRLDEAAWQEASPIREFVQGEPREGAAPAEATEVRVLYDSEALYVGARLHESDPEAIHDQLVRRDARGAFDFFEVGLDPNLDGRTGYRFRVSAAGVEGDAYLYADEEEDEDWDAVWDSGVHRDMEGWSVEMRIPLSQIRFETAKERWGVNFSRRRLASNSVDFFSLESRTASGKVSQFGRLEGVEIESSPTRFELQPFAVSELRTASVDPENPLVEATEIGPRAGLDLSWGVGSAFSLAATFNPDFGQVEVDPEVINLTAFETFFPEKRPFFVQDARIFDFELSGRRNRLFFSRRIGREPRGDAPDAAEFADMPDRTTILGAAKFTGRTGGGLSVGALAAVTDAEEGRAYFADSDEVEAFPAQPLTHHGVIRLQQDFRGGASRVGGILTAQNRRLPGSGALDFLPSEAFSAGLDFEHAWGGARAREWRLSGFFAGSLVHGSERALRRIQTASNHYFQRPDADYLDVDSTATSMIGRTWRLQFERQDAEHWTGAVWLGEVGPGFEVNDLGFFTEGEELDVGGRLAYREIDPGDVVREWRLSAFSFHNFRHSLLDDFFSADGWTRAYKGGHVSLDANVEFTNNWGLNLDLGWSPEALSDTETRGGPLMTDPASVSAQLRANTDRRAVVGLEPSVEHTARMREAGHSTRLGLGISFRPAPSWEIEIEPRYEWSRDAAQYVATIDAVPYEPTYGRRYLFGDLDRRELSLETRLNVALTPDLSLQAFLQPLVSAGDFAGYAQLARPESFEFIPFAEGEALEGDEGVTCAGGATCETADHERWIDFDGDGAGDFSFRDEDFNIRSLRGSAVLRWEYRPGSVLFLVWQQSRRDRSPVGDFDLGGDLDALFGAPGENTVILKVSHYLRW